ncbi:MAG: FlgD immunoglobulin-like domain containing protein [Candidatus Marinimicrobia bacterium]|nr:FlgD immunoglobulin-like domain containing protein [Candidatus Neomarinimicrobiota bacterium]
MGQNYPNPFNPVTAFDFALPEAGHTVIRVYDVRGALVNTLVSGHRDAGRYHVQWNGRDAGGNPAASGVYLIRMEAGDFRESRKMLLVR